MMEELVFTYTEFPPHLLAQAILESYGRESINQRAFAGPAPLIHIAFDSGGAT